MKLSSLTKKIFVTGKDWSTEPVERASYYSYFAGQI